MSVTVTVKLQVLWLPLASYAVLVTVVTPMGKVVSLGGLTTRPTRLQSSIAMTEKETLLRLHRLGSAVNTRLLGQMISGL